MSSHVHPQQTGCGVGLGTLAALEGSVVSVHGHDVGLQLPGLDEGRPTPLTHVWLLSCGTQNQHTDLHILTG